MKRKIFSIEIVRWKVILNLNGQPMTGVKGRRRFAVTHDGRFSLSVLFVSFSFFEFASEGDGDVRRTNGHGRGSSLLHAARLGRVRRIGIPFRSTTLEKIRSTTKKTRPTSIVVGRKGHFVAVQRRTDDAVEHRSEEIAHFRTKFLRRQRINDDVHRMIEIHQNDTGDFDQN